MSRSRAVPILRAKSLEATAAFYEKLGFRTRAHYPHQYLIVERGPLELHFIEHELDPATTVAGAYLRIEGTDELYREFAGLGIPLGRCGWPRVQGPPDETGEFAVVDPDGNLLRFGQRGLNIAG